MVYYIIGDLFIENSVKAIVHGCNCEGGMSAGIAIRFKQKWPKMFIIYKKICLSGKFTLGTSFIWKTEERNSYIFNLAIQNRWKSAAVLDIIILGMYKIINKALENDINYVVLPKIGSGYGKLEWHNIKLEIEKLVYSVPIDLIICEEYVYNVSLSNFKNLSLKM